MKHAPCTLKKPSATPESGGQAGTRLLLVTSLLTSLISQMPVVLAQSTSSSSTISSSSSSASSSSANSSSVSSSSELFRNDSSVSKIGSHPIVFNSASRSKATISLSSRYPVPVFEKLSDPYSSALSPDALQLCQILELTDQFKRVNQLQAQANQYQEQGQKVPVELRQDIADLQIQLLAAIEQARLDIEYVVAEIEEEQAGMDEILRIYSADKEKRVARANLLAFRTNGALWAAAEALDIPTYSNPRFSIPSGTLGIIAGLVPSFFSEYAARMPSGTHERNAYPNMLCKIFDLPTKPRFDYPLSVWRYLNSVPPGGETRCRRQIIVDHWWQDINIKSFSHGIHKDEMLQVSGVDQSNVTIDLMDDRLTMLRQVKAITLLMNRPLLELAMAMRGSKHFQ